MASKYTFSKANKFALLTIINFNVLKNFVGLGKVDKNKFIKPKNGRKSRTRKRHNILQPDNYMLNYFISDTYFNLRLVLFNLS